jgi:hypothetical protein
MFLSRAIPATLSSQQTRIYGVSPRFLAKIFVGSDIVSLLMQAGGAAIASGKHVTDKKRNIGKDLLLAGLILQIATFSIFLLMVTGFTRRLPAEKTSRHKGLGKVILGIYVAGALIQVCVESYLAHKIDGLVGLSEAGLMTRYAGPIYLPAHRICARI